MKKNVVVLPGDGIGPEVTEEVIKILTQVGILFGVDVTISKGLIGGASIDANGKPIQDEVIELCRKADCVFLGAVGGPKWDSLPIHLRPEAGLLRIRKELRLFTNLRPVKMFEPLLESSTLKREVISGIDIIVVRELTAGIYFGKPKYIKEINNEEEAVDTMRYRTHEIERIARVGFETAQKRRKKITSVDKANVLASSRLWRSVVDRVSKSFPDVELNHMLVDNCAMQLVRNPGKFDVILTCNMFGDILSDEAAMLTGSLGMLPSASIGECSALYEPVHGSAPDIAGKNIANPLAAIGSVALMFRYSFLIEKAAITIENGIQRTLEKGYRTQDIAGKNSKYLSTSQIGDKVKENILEEYYNRL